MEILARRIETSGRFAGYLVSMSDEELQKLTGRMPEFYSLDIVDISSQCDKLEALRVNQDTISKNVRTLRALAELLEPLKDMVEEAIKPAKE